MKSVVAHSSPVTHRPSNFVNVDANALIVSDASPASQTKLKHIGRPDHRSGAEIDELVKAGALVPGDAAVSQCKFCRNWISSGLGRKHLAGCVRVPRWITVMVEDQHGPRSNRFITSRYAIPWKQSHRCSFCKAQFKSVSELQEHTGKSHRIVFVKKADLTTQKRSSKTQKISKNRVMGVTELDWVTCDGCRAKIKANHVSRHMKRCPGIPPGGTKRNPKATTEVGKTVPRAEQPAARRTLREATKSTGRNGAGTTPQALPPASAATRLNDRRTKQNFGRDPYDATRDYAYPCRESGKYGSHPLHDDFSDEGGPE